MCGKKEQKDEISRKILSQDLSDRLATINEICDGFKSYRKNAVPQASKSDKPLFFEILARSLTERTGAGSFLTAMNMAADLAHPNFLVEALEKALF